MRWRLYSTTLVAYSRDFSACILDRVASRISMSMISFSVRGRYISLIKVTIISRLVMCSSP